MGAWGALIMSFFGAVFAALTLIFQLHWAEATVFLPFIVFGAIAFTAIVAIYRPGRTVPLSKRAERAIMWSSIGEGVGLFVAANLVTNLGHRELLLPAMCLVVGLHFLPIAYAVPFRPFYALAASLLAAATLGFVVDPPLNGEIAGFAAAGVLWVAAILAVRREFHSKSS